MDTSFGLVLGGTEAVQVASPSDLPSDLLETLQRATRVVVFTGAGMSKDSGLDTFRDAQTGIWENLNPQDMASLDFWARDPDPMYAIGTNGAAISATTPNRTPATTPSPNGKAGNGLAPVASN